MGNLFQLVVNNVEWLNKYTFVELTYLDSEPSNALLKVSKFQKQIILLSILSKNERKNYAPSS